MSSIRPSISRRLAVPASALGLAAATLLTATAPAASSGDPDGASPTGRSALLDAQRAADRLGATAAGVYQSGDDLVVNVTDRSAFDDIRAAGATPRIVEHSTAELERVTEAIEASPDIVGTAWGIDPISNEVVVRTDQTVSATELARLRQTTARFGDMVSIDRVPGRMTTAISGGDAIWGGGGGRCSLGFHVTDGSSTYFLTAGHCTDAISRWYEDSGQAVHLGDTLDSSFPGDDYGLSTTVGDGGVGDVNRYDGTYTDISSARQAVVGERVERSGSTTGLHDGSVLALDVSVTYPQGTVHGLIETDVCAEPGDSGGALFAGSDALGLTSGGSGDCTYGGMTYFQPVIEPLDEYSLSVY